MKTLKNDLTCEFATHEDDVKRIAGYLHLTDPYIYPTICKNCEDPDFVSLIGSCMKSAGNLYHTDHLITVKKAGVPVGIACVIPCGKTFVFSEGLTVPAAIQSGIELAEKGYFQPLLEENLDFEGYNVVNFCVDANLRGQGVGSLLMSFLLEQYGKSPIHLDVVASNTAAIGLYKKFGFVIQKEYEGFSGSDQLLPCYHMLRKA